MSVLYKMLTYKQWSSDGVFINIFSSVLLIFTSVLIYLNCRRRRGVPPGPPRFPVLGNLPSIASRDILKNLATLRENYGDIFSLYIGTELVVVLNGYETIYDAFVKKGSQFIYRPPSALKNINTGVLYCNGKHWKEQRCFLQKTLQDVCLRFSARNVEEIINVEARELVAAIEKRSEAFDVTDYVRHAGLNVMFLVTYGKRFDFGDVSAVKFAENMDNAATQVAKIQILSNLFPFLQYLPGDMIGNEKRVALKEAMHGFVRNLAGTNKEDKRNHNNTMWTGFSLADAFNDEIEAVEYMEKETNKVDNETTSDSVNQKCSFTDACREDTMVDLIGAGGDTTATSVMWVLLHLVREQEVQNMVYDEIQTHIGPDREPCLEDRDNMPYTHAVILESLRLTTTAPLALPHSVVQDTIFHGYLIPTDATVIANVTTALGDSKVWCYPEKFDPHRFLTKDSVTGKTCVEVPDQFIPFSLGPRSCIGETVAKMEVFLVITALVQRFSLFPAPGTPMPGIEGELGITYRPKPFSIKFEKRQ